MDAASRHECAYCDTPTRPITQAWVDCRLRVLAERAGAGESEETLRGELLAQIWPWMTSTADWLARTVPPGGDQAAVHSEVIWEGYQAVRRIEWDRYRAWPGLLRARVRGGYSTAARADDILTRGQRRARSLYLDQVDRSTHELARTLTLTERRRLAAALSPYGRITPVMLGRSMVVSLEEANVEELDEAADPGAVLEHTWTAQAVGAWLDQDVPAELARCVHSTLRDGRDVPSRLCAALKPFVAKLRSRLGA